MMKPSAKLKRLDDPSPAAPLFEGCEETMVWSCLQSVMGEILVAVPDEETAGERTAEEGQEHPVSACAHLANFYFFAGEPQEEMLLAWSEMYHGALEGEFVILVPLNKAWERLMDIKLSDAEKGVRYAIKKEAKFDRSHLESLAAGLPADMELRRIDGKLYDACLSESWSEDFVRTFASREDFLEKAVGVVCLKNGEILAGCSAYSRYADGIEVEVDTREDQRRKHLATCCAAALILECLDRGLYPSWDAMNRESVGLAEKLGYEFSHEYPVFMYG